MPPCVVESQHICVRQRHLCIYVKRSHCRHIGVEWRLSRGADDARSVCRSSAHVLKDETRAELLHQAMRRLHETIADACRHFMELPERGHLHNTLG